MLAKRVRLASGVGSGWLPGSGVGFSRKDPSGLMGWVKGLCLGP